MANQVTKIEASAKMEFTQSPPSSAVAFIDNQSFIVGCREGGIFPSVVSLLYRYAVIPRHLLNQFYFLILLNFFKPAGFTLDSSRREFL